jgi:hypothetical protein
MSAIGGKVGSAIFVKEINEEVHPVYGFYNTMAASNAMADTIYRPPLSFAPEKVRCVILARFEIQ